MIYARFAGGSLATALGAIVIVAGAILCIGGGWIWHLYQIPIGLALIGSGWLLRKQRVEGAWLYMLAFVAMIAGAWWEVGTNAFSLLVRLMPPTLTLIIILAIASSLREYHHEFELPAVLGAGLLLLVGSALIACGPYLQPIGGVAF